MDDAYNDRTKVDENTKQIAHINVSIGQHAVILERVSQTIEKLTDLTAELSKLASIYDERQNYQLLFNNELKMKVNNEIIDTKETFKQYDLKLSTINRKIENLEKWRWLIIGGVIVASLIFPDFRTMVTALMNM